MQCAPTRNRFQSEVTKVALMGDVYPLAKEVFIWLGPSTQTSRAFFRRIRNHPIPDDVIGVQDREAVSMLQPCVGVTQNHIYQEY